MAVARIGDNGGLFGVAGNPGEVANKHTPAAGGALLHDVFRQLQGGDDVRFGLPEVVFPAVGQCQQQDVIHIIHLRHLILAARLTRFVAGGKKNHGARRACAAGGNLIHSLSSCFAGW